MSNVVTKSCVSCGKKFETSKFTPYVTSCLACKKDGKKSPIKKGVKKDKNSKNTKPWVDGKKDVWIEGKKDTKVWDGRGKIIQVLAPPPAVAPKSYVPVENKEAIFLHLLQKGYKLSGMNTPYKIYPKIKVMCPLSDAYTKIIVNYLHSDGKFDGSNILMTKKDVKDLPKEVREELAEVIDLIYPPEAAK